MVYCQWYVFLLNDLIILYQEKMAREENLHNYQASVWHLESPSGFLPVHMTDACKIQNISMENYKYQKAANPPLLVPFSPYLLSSAEIPTFFTQNILHIAPIPVEKVPLGARGTAQLQDCCLVDSKDINFKGKMEALKCKYYQEPREQIVTWSHGTERKQTLKLIICY